MIASLYGAMLGNGVIVTGSPELLGVEVEVDVVDPGLLEVDVAVVTGED